MDRGLLTGISKFAPASISIWTMASSPAAQAYMRGVIPFRKEKTNENKVIFLSLSTVTLSWTQRA